MPARPSATWERPIEVQIVDQTKQKKLQIVSDTQLRQLEEKVEEVKRKAQFLSRETVRVQKESRATVTDLTRNGDNRPEKRGSSKEKAQKKRSFGEKSNDLALQRPQPLDPAVAAGSGVSTISEYIPNVEAGSITALNTDRLSYFTFFERVNTQLRNRWVENVRMIAERANQATLSSLASRTRHTEVEVVLDTKGYLFEVNIMKSSGYEPLDRAAKMAFQDAQPFLNPPMDLIDRDDNMIRLYYGFTVEFAPRFMAGP